MPAINRESLLTLEAYSKQRNQFRAEVIAHKKHRTVHLGEHLTLIFEDELTMRYQVQEMLRIEKIFEEQGIQDELDTYNPLVPDGSNFKATMMIEYASETERARAPSPSSRASRTACSSRSRARRGCTRSPTRTWSAKTPKKPLRCISCALN